MIFPMKRIGVKDIMDSPVKADMTFWLAKETSLVNGGPINQALGVTEERLGEESLNEISQSKERYL
jgi:hypothetical protein